MRVQLRSLAWVFLSLAVQGSAADKWSFTDGLITVSTRGNTEAARKEQFSPGASISSPITLSAKDTLKIVLTTQEDSTSKRPHQAFLLLQDPATKLETFFPFVLKENGKGRVDIQHKDVPQSLLTPAELHMSVVLGSFGSSTPFLEQIATIKPVLDTAAKASIPEKPLRYGKLDEIIHVFRAEPRNPPKIITLVFLIGVLVQLPALFMSWLGISANVSALSPALSRAPLAHPVFFLSLLALEGVFFAYYVKTTLFQTLAAASIVAPVAFLSGSRALREVRVRRLEGKR